LTSEKSFREPRGRGFNDRGFAPRQRGGPASRRQPFAGPQVGATVKWFSPEKGFGFVALADGSGDAFLHAKIVEQSGQDAAALLPGATVRVQISHGLKGAQVSDLFAIDASTATVSPPAQSAGRASDRKPTRMTGTVKWYSPVKRFGFIAADGGRQEVFVHAAALQRSGVPNLFEGQRVEMEVAEGRKGREAVSISLC